MDIKVKKIDPNLPDFEKLKQGDWIDLYVSSLKKVMDDDFVNIVKNDFIYDNNIIIRKGYSYLLGLGFACQLPNNYEAYVLPRSSLFKNTGLLLTNSCGIIDESYSGNDDEWMAHVYATTNCIIKKYNRLFQFRIQKKMPELNFKYVDELENKNRGGFGSTGK